MKIMSDVSKYYYRPVWHHVLVRLDETRTKYTDLVLPDQIQDMSDLAIYEGVVVDYGPGAGQYKPYIGMHSGGIKIGDRILFEEKYGKVQARYPTDPDTCKGYRLITEQNIVCVLEPIEDSKNE